MMGITIDINGNEIGEFGVWNTSEIDEDGRIRYEIHNLGRIESERICDDTYVTDVWHYREDGASTLTEIVMEEIDESMLDVVTREQ